MKLETLKRYIEEHGNITVTELKDIIEADKKEGLINELETHHAIEFEHNGLWFNVFAMDCEAGYYIDIFEDEESFLNNISMNGGLCTGTAKDALEMFIEWDVTENKGGSDV